jgi:hypothetical protein
MTSPAKNSLERDNHSPLPQIRQTRPAMALDPPAPRSGHRAVSGDRFLVSLSEMIRSVLPGGALAARLGGDEFVILLNDASSERVVVLIRMHE